ncbi:Anthranilate synthase component 2 [Fundidesulfovibrio magnetotacticus]|uniref:Anthranilate synthase component 2 n=1 Tax=Fundidesulfovibrio magnetotacticus TaxID=2730080 RepID=A0A6V8LX20_9BACT|nr:aminodeoxychorismate/anthranilate synthase component II [Fundidesulfovibrio magnetotacticus]GFK94629.1 Anthranilate synthase component 2 [Fundidesulfovibrio magnetotacticus]
MRILLVDHRDSFTRNLEHLLARAAGSAPEIVPCFGFRPRDADAFDLTVLSPGPGHPREHTGYGPLLESGRPVLGVCLGLQIINLHFGGAVERLPGCVHGRAGRFRFLGREIEAGRYHSLHLSRMAPDLELLAQQDGIPMAARHCRLPVAGVQFHPESFLTPQGPEILHDLFQLVLPR